MILLQNGVWKTAFAEEGILIPSALKIIIVLGLLIATFAFSGCETEPLKPNYDTVDFWEHAVEDNDHKEVTAITFDTQGHMFIAEKEIGVTRLSQVQGFWERVSTYSFPDNSITELHSDSSTGFLYAGTYSGSLYRSTDFGTTWRDITPITPDSDKSYLNFVAGIGTTPDFELFCGLSHDGVMYSTDFGSSWTNIFGPPSINGITTLTIAGDAFVYAGTLEEGIYQGGFFENIPVWTVTTGFTHQVTIAYSSNDKTHFGTNDGLIYVWDESGITEVTAGSRLNAAVIDIISSPGGQLFVAIEKGGVWSSEGGGSEGEGTGFVEVNSGLYERWGRVLAIDNYGYLYLGTETEGVFRTVFPIHFYDGTDS